MEPVTFTLKSADGTPTAAYSEFQNSQKIVLLTLFRWTVQNSLSAFVSRSNLLSKFVKKLFSSATSFTMKIDTKRLCNETSQNLKTFSLFQLGRNPSSIGSTLVNQGEVQVLGPGGVFSFLQGKHSFSVQFFDKLVSTKNDSPLQKNDITKGIKGMFKSLRRSMSRESLASLDDVKVMTASPQNDSSKKRKREREIDETRSNESSKKLRKSVSGTLTSCITGNEESGIDINDLKMEFGEDIVREINCDRSSLKLVGEEIFNDMKTDAGISDDNFTWNSAVNSDSKVTKNTWVTQEGLMVFSGKGLEAKEKVCNWDLIFALAVTFSQALFCEILRLERQTLSIILDSF